MNRQAQKEFFEKVDRMMEWMPRFMKAALKNPAHWGHTDLHLYTEDTELQRRLKKDGNKSKYTPFASSCFQMKSMRELIDFLLPQILDEDILYEISCWWCEHKTKEYPLILNCEEVIGKCFETSRTHEWKNGAIPCKDILILIRANSGPEFKPWIETAYPISERTLQSENWF
jgi:hypothetical protein